MERIRKKPWLTAGAWAAACYAVAAIAAQLLLRNLYRFLPADTDFPAIFSQIRTAAMVTPFLPVFLGGYLSCLLLRSVCRGRYSWLWAGLLTPVLLVILLAGGLFLTRVNGIRFGDILVSLLDVLEKGGLDGL